MTGTLRVSLWVIAAWFAVGTAWFAWQGTRTRNLALLVLAVIAAFTAAVTAAAAGDLR